MDLVQSLTAFLDGLMEFLKQSAADPVTYSIIFFVYAVLAAIILPIPVEVGLLLSPATPPLVLAIILGLGKAVGSVVVFYFGTGVGDRVRVWTERWRWFSWLFNKSEWLVAKLHYVGLYIILSIPLMSDTIPLYIFSVLNEKGVFKVQWFALVNFLAGVTRAIILFVFLYVLGINLFS